MATTPIPASLPENEDMDPVGEPYPNQGPHDPDLGDDPPHPENAPFDEPDIPLDEESERDSDPSKFCAAQGPSMPITLHDSTGPAVIAPRGRYRQAR